jgi:hypothetical protein
MCHHVTFFALGSFFFFGGYPLVKRPVDEQSVLKTFAKAYEEDHHVKDADLQRLASEAHDSHGWFLIILRIARILYYYCYYYDDDFVIIGFSK